MKWGRTKYLEAKLGQDELGIHPSYLLCTGFKNMFRKLLKIPNQQDPNFFLIVLLELWFVYHFPRYLQFFDVGAQSLIMRRENGTKLKNLTFDLNLLLAPTKAHKVFICICFLVVSFFMLACFFSWVLDGATIFKQLKTARGRFSLMF